MTTLLKILSTVLGGLQQLHKQVHESLLQKKTDKTVKFFIFKQT